MTMYYDDNFGEWSGMTDYDDPDGEMREFYAQVQAESVEKTCEQCGRRVRIRPQYSICNSCADMIERGW